jgi:hypothetical protein
MQLTKTNLYNKTNLVLNGLVTMMLNGTRSHRFEIEQEMDDKKTTI